ncbi:hypothetical protein ONZ43_g3810 [Nemania bipapillata]|uniref:Uncharacterized protein n=1 Tax=Nemania bipapillata TaxID=110536 RepID=A0ACC2IVF4_9PEZI|nr:hypothetical protein ONZ43_g3810 [Nemania bipapillata]
MVAATRYGEISQSDNHHDQDGGLSPTESLSPVLSSSSPMPFLPAVETTFTPLSMDSDFDAATTAITARSGMSQAIDGPLHDLQKPVAHNTAASTMDSSEHHTISFGAGAPSLPSLGFNANIAINPSQQGSHALGHHALDTRTDANFAPNMGINSIQNTAGDQVSQQPFGTSADELSQPQVVPQPVLVKPKPIVRTASTKSVSLRHPIPDLNPRSASHASNIAQLEATAEKLSMTSSIDDAIRELHDEQKRVDSRRSSILAASIASIPEIDEHVMFPLSKQISVASSIRETNTAARHGGYSPAGYVMSPSSPMVSGGTRLRSGSTGMSKSDADPSSSLSRHGPGKSSVRSVRSATKPTLTNIAEIEPTALTAAAMDAADRLAEEPDEDDALHVPQMQDKDITPNANLYYESSAHEYWDQPIAEAHQQGHNYVHDRPPSAAGSDGTFEQAERAFADFDGAHCAPDTELEDSVNFETLFTSPMMESPFIPSYEPDPVSGGGEAESSRPLISRPMGPPTVRPKSYLNPATGETMLYYPARVPMMLNLPQKLSKKPKTQARNDRKSQLLSSMPNPLGPVIDDSNPALPSNSRGSQEYLSRNLEDGDETPPDSHAQPNDINNRMSRISMMGPSKRKSQLPDLSKLPPQLRASTYFELPSQVPTIQLKDGSATSTLDDILNASAKAPVSAFTDHAFAGSLGAEVYGTDKKRKSHMKSSSVAELYGPKNRSSIFHLRKPSALSRHSDSQGERRGSGSIDNNEERQHLSGSIDGEPVENGDEESEESEEEPVYNGPPTTLLAELQMRKQQQKLRTRPVASAFPNGMHSTLLEMDTVAEVERRARKGKKINLAWEDPSMNQADEDEDEDTPLGLLLATKGQSAGLIDTIPGAPRPLGLMERRDMEDNEPLSVRRNRLQGREAGPIQRMTLARGLNMAPALRVPSPQLRVVTPEGDEIENETLGDRMRRLRSRDDNNPLPLHRPVSSAFSAELLSQLGDAFKEEEPEAKESSKGKGKIEVQPTEEEETLGQRRRRLQAEREAREREMTRVQLNGGPSSISPQLTKRHSLADVLGGQGSKTVLSDPRVDAERARQEEAARYKEDQKRKLAALRHQIPSNLSAPNLVKPGGFMSGRFNDGTGGGFGQPRDSTIMGGFGSNSAIPNPAVNASAMGNAFRAGGAMSTYIPPMTNPYAGPYEATPQVQSTGQMASIERWRQGIS